METTLAWSKALVIGNGRIGKLLSRKLHFLGADVTVLARKSQDFADIRSNNLKFAKYADVDYGEYDVIFNTVPSVIFTGKILERLPREILIIDLACGVDLKAAQDLSIKTIKAPSLPSKVAPKTAGKFIYDSVLDILSEQEVI